MTDLTLRDHLASLAMQSLIPIDNGNSKDDVAQLAHEYADAMMRARDGAPKPLDLPGGWRQVGESFEGPNVGEAITMPREGVVRVWQGEDFVEVDVHALAAIVSRMGYRVEEL